MIEIYNTYLLNFYYYYHDIIVIVVYFLFFNVVNAVIDVIIKVREKQEEITRARKSRVPAEELKELVCRNSIANWLLTRYKENYKKK